jgi:hypothetical protein
MQCCTTCGTTEDLRLYEVHDEDHVERRWWCLECLFSARRLGVMADLAPAWIERAALHQLPMKPLVPADSGADSASQTLSRSALLLASQHLLALATQADSFVRGDDDVAVDNPVHSVAATAGG